MSSIASKIDHTCLGKGLSYKELDEVLREAKEYGMNICIPMFYLESIDTDDFQGEVCTVVGFPHGNDSIRSKHESSRLAIRKGATEIDYCGNITYLREDESKFEFEARLMASLPVTTKCIIETGILSRGEIIRASKICSDEGVDFVKTCSGFTEGQAEVEDVHLINNIINEETKVKASGGIGTYNEAMEMLDAGADRIGASSGVQILESKT